MNNRGQAALEYLMTYGWALIVIAIVVGVLVFIVSSPASNVTCSSSDPTKVMMKASNTPATMDIAIAATNITTIKLSNITGGDMKSVACGNFSGAFGDTNGDLGCDSEIKSGVEFTLTPDASNTPNTYSTSSFYIFYDDYAGFRRNAKITCSGPIKIV